jgi:hypothetical protein
MLNTLGHVVAGGETPSDTSSGSGCPCNVGALITRAFFTVSVSIYC